MQGSMVAMKKMKISVKTMFLGQIKAPLRAHSGPQTPPLPPARICTHLGDPPPPLAACALYGRPLIEMLSRRH